MDPCLERLHRELEASYRGMTSEQLASGPSGKWSTAEVLEHLYLTYTGTIKGFSRVAEAGKSLATRSSWTHRGRRMVVLGMSYLPGGRKSPEVARPRGLPTEQVLSEIAGKIGEMDAMIGICEQKVGRGKLLDHPVLGPLTAAQWRKFHLVHGLHHVKQIRALRKRAAPGN